MFTPDLPPRRARARLRVTPGTGALPPCGTAAAPLPARGSCESPAIDPAAHVTLARALARAGFDEDGLEALLGAPDGGLSRDEQHALWAWRARGRGARAVLARLFLLQRPVPGAAARAALGDEGLRAAVAVGCARWRGRAVEPRVQLAAPRGLLVASDPDPQRRAPPADHVPGPTTATLLLERVTVRLPARRALDLGTGCGYLALRLAAHCRAVDATDVSARALAFARANAALNRAGNVSFVRSDRFTRLRGRRYDLITGNLPFVVSPERRFVYRDAGGDEFLASVVRQTGAHLVEGGVAQYLAQWAHRDGEDEDERVAPWLVAARCDALVVRLERQPADEYAARWLSGPRAPRARRARAPVCALDGVLPARGHRRREHGPVDAAATRRRSARDGVRGRLARGAADRGADPGLVRASRSPVGRGKKAAATRKERGRSRSSRSG